MSDPPAGDLADLSERLRHPLQHRLLDYWRSKAPAGGLPSRRDIDPVEMGAKLLPWLVLYDVVWEHARPRFRFRLVGTGNVERYGRDATGKWFEEAYQGDILESQVATFTAVAESGAPDFSRRRLPLENKQFIEYERLILPLASDGRQVDNLIALMIFD
jgi:hypothetical protein